ncbi:hypothetical protein V3C99_018522, partial [Haemonchus contortus]
MLGSSLYL